MDTLLAPYLADPRIAAVGNLMMSLIVLAWTFGMKPRVTDRVAWRGWLGFWIGTSLFYVCQTLSPTWEGIPFVALYAATWSLLAAYLHAYLARARSVAASIVAIAVLVDVITSRLGYEPGLHQVLTAAVLMLWAWRIREQSGESTALMPTRSSSCRCTRSLRSCSASRVLRTTRLRPITRALSRRRTSPTWR